MNISGPPLVTPSQKPDDPLLSLRVNQRFAAEVLQVSGEQIALSIQGVRVVAKLSSPDQSAGLIERRMAQFIVKDMSGPVVSLQVLKPGVAPGAGLQASENVSPELAQRLLLKAGLPLDEININIARALLQNGLPVSADLILELKAALEGLGSVNDEAIQNAAMLKADGLPVTAGSLSLARWNQSDLTENLVVLKNQLQAWLLKSLNSDLRPLGEQALAVLNDLILQWKPSATEMADGLKAVIQRLGTPLEQELAKVVLARENGDSSSDFPPNLMTLALLRNGLTAQGEQRLADSIDRFLETTRWIQFNNSQPDFEPAKGQWLKMDLPLGIPSSSMSSSNYEEARLRIAYHSEEGKSEISPAYTRLVVQVELSPGEVLDVDLSVVGKQVGAQITATSQQLNSLAEQELPDFQEGLKKLGYFLKSVRCNVELNQPSGRRMDETGHKTINVEA